MRMRTACAHFTCCTLTFVGGRNKQRSDEAKTKAEMSRSHHFRGAGQYAEKLMDFAEGRPVFNGRGQKPSNKEVLAAIASIKKCRQGAFFKFADKPCTCGWHTKAAVRKRARQAQSDATPGLNLLSPPVHPAPLHPGGVTESWGSNLLSPPVHPAPLHPGGVTESRGSNLLSDSPSVRPAPLHPGGVTESLAAASTSSTIASEVPHKTGSGPVPPKFDRSDFQAPTMRELRAIGIGIHISPSKLDLLVYCPLKGRCPHCESALITANSVGKRKLCYAIPWPKSIVGVDMRCGKCKKHFMTHDTNYVDTLPSAEQVKREFVTAKGNGSHISLLRMLRSGLTVAQVERYIDDEVKQHYLKLKANYIELWDKVHYIHMY